MTRFALDLPIEIVPAGEHSQEWWLEPFGLNRESALVYWRANLSRGVVASGAGLSRMNRPLPLAPQEPRAALLCHPSEGLGLGAAIRATAAGNELFAVWPVVSHGVQHQLVPERLILSEDRLQAYVVAAIGDLELCYFDPLFIPDRGFYAAGCPQDVILNGIAHKFDVIEPEPFFVGPDAETYEALVRVTPGTVGEDGKIRFETKGMAAIFPLKGTTRNAYEFRGPVLSVRKLMLDLAGHPVWLIRVAVARIGEDLTAVEIDIAVTDLTLPKAGLPEVGQDVAGVAVLNGTVWAASCSEL